MGSAGSVSQFGMRRDRRSVAAAISTTRLRITRMGKGSMASSREQRGRTVAVDPLPAQSFERGNERIVVRQQRVREAEFVDLGAPSIAQLRQARVLLQKFGAIEIAAAVEEDFPGARESI